MYFLDKSIPINGLSPVPRDQCTNGISGNNKNQMEIHAMYSSFRTAAQPQMAAGGPPPPPPPPPSALHNGKDEKLN